MYTKDQGLLEIYTQTCLSSGWILQKNASSAALFSASVLLLRADVLGFKNSTLNEVTGIYNPRCALHTGSQMSCPFEMPQTIRCWTVGAHSAQCFTASLWPLLGAHYLRALFVCERLAAAVKSKIKLSLCVCVCVASQQWPITSVFFFSPQAHLDICVQLSAKVPDCGECVYRSTRSSICWELCTTESSDAWLYVKGSSCVVRLMRLRIEDGCRVTEMIYTRKTDRQLGGNICLYHWAAVTDTQADITNTHTHSFSLKESESKVTTVQWLVVLKRGL